MKVTRIYTGPDNQSHFQDVEIAMGDTHGGNRRSAAEKAKEVIFIESAVGTVVDWHPAPCRQFVITIEGNAEIEISDGSKRHFGPGDVLLAEDITGRGHITRTLGNRPRRSIFVPLG